MTGRDRRGGVAPVVGAAVGDGDGGGGKRKGDARAGATAPVELVDIEDLTSSPSPHSSSIPPATASLGKQRRTAAPSTVAAADSSTAATAFWGHGVGYHDFSEGEVTAIRRSLLQWYYAHRRKLPWRGDPPPYGNATGPAAAAAAAAPAKPNKAGNSSSNSKKITAFFTKTKEDKEEQQESPGPSSPFFAKKKQKTKEDGEPVAASATAVLVPVQEEQEKDTAGEQPLPVASVPLEEGGQGGVYSRSPYGTWVSEIMLQQTRVETVIGYWQRWMALFPTVEALAQASDEDVNAVWAGLGYYRRARMLQQGARLVLEKHGGQLPSTVEELKAIPGIGPYSAGAVASIAHGTRAGMVDGNVQRVLSRLRAVRASPKHSPFVKYSWRMAELLVDEHDPGGFNQALMELGATVCKPQSPCCSTCPVQQHCLAFRLAQHPPPSPSTTSPTKSSSSSSCCSLCETSSYFPNPPPTPATLPLKAMKKPPRVEHLAVAVVERQGAFLLLKRPAEGLLAGQWEFPSITILQGQSQQDEEEQEEGGSSPIARKSKGNKKGEAKPEGGAGKGKRQIEEGEEKKEGLLVASPPFALVDRLEADLALTAAHVQGWRSCGRLTHIFSHVRHEMALFHTSVGEDAHSAAATSALAQSKQTGRAVAWMDEQAMAACGITTGVKKILQAVREQQQKPPPPSTTAAISSKKRGKATTSGGSCTGRKRARAEKEARGKE